MNWQVIFGAGSVNVRVYVTADTEAAAVDTAVRQVLETAEAMYGWVAEQKGRGLVTPVNVTPVHQRPKDRI